MPPLPMSYCLYPTQKGQHIWIKIYAGGMGTTRGSAGTVIMTVDEWKGFKEILQNGAGKHEVLIREPATEKET